LVGRIAGALVLATLAFSTGSAAARDLLIVSIGDSVAAGEGVPDVPGFGHAVWQSVRCHRSARAGVALAAKQIEEDDNRGSVTFVNLACSGATVPAGLLGPYGGVEPPPGEPPLEPQVSVLNQIAARRPVDAVLVSIGANDIHFGEIVRFCSIVPARDCFTRPLPELFGGDGTRTVAEVAADSLSHLTRRYRRLAGRISPRIPASRVHIVQYFDPTHDAAGNTCKRILGSVTKPELEQAQSRMLSPLNEAVAVAASENGWDLVSGVAQLFREHGYCAGRQAWVTTLSRSFEGLGGTLKGRFLGTLHPNQAGHEATSTLISEALERDLFPGRVFPPRPLPKPAEEGDSGIVTWLLIVLAGAAALLLLGPGAVVLALGALTWALIGGLLWLGRETVSPLLLGLAAGALLLIVSRERTPTPRRIAGALKPLVSLAKTARPLLLPLLVVIAVGTVKFSPVVQVLAGAILLVLAWRLIVAPEAKKSEVEWGRRLAGKIALLSAIAIGLGAVVVFAARRVWDDNPYLQAIGDLASGLLLVAVVLWTFAFALRLFSFATTRVRAVLALAIGLALLILAMAVGVLPGKPAVHDAWPQLFTVFAGCALVLLASDMVLSARAGEGESRGKPTSKAAGGGKKKPLTSRVAELGFIAAAAAAVILAVSTGYGLIDAAEQGQPLNPPEDESAEAQALAPAATADDGNLELAKKYAPVLAFTKDERWAPIPVDSYVANATLSGPPGTPRKVSSLDELKACPLSAESWCYTLSIECESGDMPCAHGSPHTPGRLYRDGAVYVRVLNKGELPATEPQDVFAELGPYRAKLTTLIQYWYFYYYDEWEAPVFAGLLTQRHEADWEAVTLGLDGNRRPLFVADSAHCAGSWRPWKKIEASTLLPGPRIHPLVAAAEGSHANYADPNQRRSPDWASCAGAPAGITTALSYASNIRDKTEYGWLWYPPADADAWILARPDEPPMSFKGSWGADDRTTLRNFRSNPLGDPGHGPLSPPLQALWREPVKLIFCGKYTPRTCTRDGG
jgi:lysophospholipase L1-like esterase